MARKHHHQVSAGYQRLFGPDGKITLLDKQTRLAKERVSVLDSFARRHFCSVLGADGTWSDDLEDEWQKLEDDSLPRIRRLNAGDRGGDAREAVKVLAAIHYARTESYLIKHEQILEQVVVLNRAALAENQPAIAAFAEDLGRPPTYPELEKRFDHIAEIFGSGRHVFVQSMRRSYNGVLSILQDMHVQLVWPRDGGPDFMFGDQAFVHLHQDGRVGMLESLALGDATTAFLPLGPRLLALFSVPPAPDMAIPRSTVVSFNDLTWRAAVRFLGSSPTTHVNKALGRWDIRIERAGRIQRLSA